MKKDRFKEGIEGFGKFLMICLIIVLISSSLPFCAHLQESVTYECNGKLRKARKCPTLVRYYTNTYDTSLDIIGKLHIDFKQDTSSIEKAPTVLKIMEMRVNQLCEDYNACLINEVEYTEQIKELDKFVADMAIAEKEIIEESGKEVTLQKVVKKQLDTYFLDAQKKYEARIEERIKASRQCPAFGEINDKKRLVVLEFKREGTHNEQLLPLARGLEEKLLSEITNRVDNIQPIERSMRNKLIEEQINQQGKHFNKSSTVEVGCLVGAEHAIAGTIIADNDILTLSARHERIDLGVVYKAVTISGDFEDRYQLQDKLVKKLVKQMVETGSGGRKINLKVW